MGLFSKTKILIAEDDSQHLEAISAALQEAGYTVDSVTDGSELVAKVEGSQPDLLVLDVSLPEVNGLTALAHLKDEHAMECPVIVLTSMAMDQSQMDVIKRHGAVYLDKAETNLATLVETIKELV